eukprot:2418470-Pyramimonas_sp.AAC.1
MGGGHGGKEQDVRNGGPEANEWRPPIRTDRHTTAAAAAAAADDDDDRRRRTGDGPQTTIGDRVTTTDGDRWRRRHSTTD